jgi:hypothetical protein
MNGLASLLRYQMGGPIGYMSGGPIGYATGGDIEAIYDALFGRAPDEDGLAFYTQELAGVPLSVAYDRIAGGAQGADAVAIQNNKDVLLDKIVENIYREQLGRPADEAGKDFYVQQLASGKTATDLSNEIDRTLEGYNFDAERIASNYRQEFGRNPEQEGFQYWMSQEDALVGKADDKAVTDAIRGGAKGVDVEALVAKPETGYTKLQTEALGADPYAGRYATVDPYYFDGVPDDAVNVSRNALDQSIQFTNPVYEQPVVSWFDQNKEFQTTAGEQGDFQQFQGLTGNNVLQREDVENAINLSLKSGALDKETAANLRDRIDPDSDNKATSWDELYQILKEPKANIVLNAMGVQVGEDVSADVALQEANTRIQLANIAAENIGSYPSALYQFTLADNIANITGENVEDIYPFTPENLGLGSIDTKKTTADVFNNVGTELGIPADKKIVRAPTISTPATQRATPFTFAPLRRGLGQLRPAMSMPGLTSGQAAFGRVASTPGQPLNNLPISAPATPYALPEDFVLQTGAYNTRDSFPSAFTPFTSSPSTAAGNTAAGPAGVDQPGSIDGGGGEVGFDQNASGFGGGSNSFGMSASNLGNAIAQGVDALGLTSVFSPSLVSEEDAAPISYASFDPGQGLGSGYLSVDDSNAAADAAAEAAGNAAIASMADTAGFGGTGDDGPTGGDGVDYEVGGLIKMAEGGEPTAPPTPPKMAELSAKEAGSTFDINDYIKEGILVGGYSKPIYDENRVITGYEYRPYESNVVFGRELRDKEAAMRQGRTGISPTTGGLAGIQIGDPEELMRQQPQYYSTVEQFRPRYAEGGNVSSTAQDLASRGRGGDTMLVHMAPHEVAGLNALARMQGTELTINPETGMPEAIKLGKLFKTLAPFIPFIPGVGQFLAPAFGALGMGGFSPLLQKAITSGIVGGFTGPKGGFDLQRGLMQGITAYGLGSLQQNLAGPSTPGGPPAPTGPAVSPELGAVDASVTSQNPLAGMEYMNTPVTGGNPLEGSQFINTIQTPGDITAASKAAEATRAGFPLSDVERGGVSDLGAPFEYQPVSPDNAATTASGMKTPTALLTTGLGVSNTADYDKLTSAGIAVKREKEEEDELYRRLFERSLGAVPVRSGGLMKLAGGGMSYMEAGGTTGPTGAPRDVVGTGDGMSDSVPADIEGVQEARLADGEFVIPADVVADIGNGSSDAGSKKLYDMMDRVRMARHDTKEQPPEIKAERLMPA